MRLIKRAETKCVAEHARCLLVEEMNEKKRVIGQQRATDDVVKAVLAVLLNVSIRCAFMDIFINGLFVTQV